MYTFEQLGEEEQARKEVCEQPNMTSNPKITAVTDPRMKKEKKKMREGLITDEEYNKYRWDLKRTRYERDRRK